MQAFKFTTVPNIDIGVNRSACLNEYCQSLAISNPFIVTDANIFNLGLIQPALDKFKQTSVNVQVFTEVTEDPPVEVVLAALAQAQQNRCDGVVGFGGGSSMDVAKLVAVLLNGEQSITQIYGVDQVTGKRMPLIQVPTTAGTGSEATHVSIVTTGETTKTGIVSAQLFADQIILDPALTTGLPGAVTAVTGIDAMVHAIEAFTSKRLKNPVSDNLAKSALCLLSSNIEIAVTEPDNLEARSNMLLGAMYAGQAFANAPVAAVHALAYPLGGIYHLSHGLSNSLVLPHVLRFNTPEADHLYQQLLPQIEAIEASTENADSAGETLAKYFEQLSVNVNIPTNLRKCGIPESSLQTLAEQSMLQERLLINNPREVTQSDALAIYRAAF